MEPRRSVKKNEKLPWTVSPVIGGRVSARNDYSLPLAGFKPVTHSCASFVGSAKSTVDCWLSGSNSQIRLHRIQETMEVRHYLISVATAVLLTLS